MRSRKFQRPVRIALQGAGLGCVMAIGLTGCRHKPVLPPLPPVIQPMAVLRLPEPDPPPMIPPVQVELPPVPMASGATPHRERRRRPSGSSATASSAATPPPDTTTPAAPAEADPIGSLSLGGEASPRAQQEAADMIASIQNRLSNLSASKVRQERSQVSRIRNFRRQAQDALSSGDVEGAKTLATKARLLLDDLEK
ncbi:hypothetical protein [Edaphobacter sp. 12200R-103]|jgi:hypothetical protein|uniref:hypothetical protein n=1 Tax=Edaphobacter sp. 12200R-103 TaxID=2703788 RepID=UPI00138C9781|nr:hypothetical protein [Edaphobacter sp. 12200R-103]QHS51503.1 hypothetical protein GWR55_06905 [Edaphobacter sp. 12200R-103]